MARKSSKARTARINELKTEYRKLAIQANRRMTNLEKLADNPEYSAVLGYAYKNAMHDLEALTGQKRFGHDIEKLSAKETDIRKLQAIINVAKEFLESPSSTKKGIDQIYGKRAKTINKKYGTNMTADDMKTFFESAIWDKLKDRLGSPVAMIVIAKVQKNADNIISDIQSARAKHRRIELSALQNIDGFNVDEMLTSKDRTIIGNLAKIYQNK